MKMLLRSSVVALRIRCAGMVTASGWSRGVRGRSGESRKEPLTKKVDFYVTFHGVRERIGMGRGMTTPCQINQCSFICV